MRSPLLPGLAALAAALLTAPAAAQEGPQPRLILSIGAGAHTGHGLWQIGTQPVQILDPFPPDTLIYDTLRLTRQISSGLVLAFSGTYFPSGHLGFYGDVTFMDLGMDDSCDPVSPYHTVNDPEAENQELCESIHGSVVGNSVLLAGIGVTFRASPRGQTNPYVRAGLGYARVSNSTTRLSGTYEADGNPFSRQVIEDESPKGGSPSILLAAGIAQGISSGYQMRLEVRDDLFALERVTGPANALGQAPTETRWYHHVSLTIGFDIVFDRKRARRY